MESKFKNGDKVKIISNGDGIIEGLATDILYFIKANNGSYYCEECNLEKVEKSPEFKIGDYVRITRKATVEEMDKINFSWALIMTDTIDSIGIISGVHPDYCAINFDNYCFNHYYPNCILEKISTPKFKIGDYVSYSSSGDSYKIDSIKYGNGRNIWYYKSEPYWYEEDFLHKVEKTPEKEIIKIGKYFIEIKNDLVRVGCKIFSKDEIKLLRDICTIGTTKYDFSIKVQDINLICSRTGIWINPPYANEIGTSIVPLETLQKIYTLMNNQKEEKKPKFKVGDTFEITQKFEILKTPEENSGFYFVNILEDELGVYRATYANLSQKFVEQNAINVRK